MNRHSRRGGNPGGVTLNEEHFVTLVKVLVQKQSEHCLWLSLLAYRRNRPKTLISALSYKVKDFLTLIYLFRTASLCASYFCQTRQK
jgi:hypothetical protein